MKIKQVTVLFDDNSIETLVAPTIPTPDPVPEPTPEPVPEPTPTPIPDPTVTTYTVVSGDTLGKIATRFKTTPEAIQALNPIITNINEISIGWILKIPQATPNPTPIPNPDPTPTDPTAKYVLMNNCTWEDNNALPYNLVTEATDFVHEVNANGSLRTDHTNAARERKLIEDASDAGKKATFSVAGGSQDKEMIKAAVTTNRAAFINAICDHLTTFNYDGVTLDIENTTISPADMVAFVKLLRHAFNDISPDLIIGIYTQPYQKDTVWARIADAVADFTWIAPMIYDDGAYNKQKWVNLTNEWLPHVQGIKSKLLTGLSINYPVNKGGLSAAQYGEMLDEVKAQGWGGVGLWRASTFTKLWQDIQIAKIPLIK